MSTQTHAHAPRRAAAPGSGHTPERPSTRAVHLDRGVITAALLGGVAAASGVALTTTAGWLIVRADQQPPVLMLLTVIVAVRAFGLARPVFRYWERLRSHDTALADLAERRTRTYAALVPLSPARLGTRGRSELLTGVVDDLTDVVEASARVTVPVLGALLSGALAAGLTALVDPRAGLVLAAMLLASALLTWCSEILESRSQTAVLDARGEVARVASMTAEHADELRAVGGSDAATTWLRRAHRRLHAAVITQSRGRALIAAAILCITGVATLAIAGLTAGSDHATPVRALLVLAPVAVGETLGVLTDATRALARARACGRRLDALLDQEPAVADPPEGGGGLPLRPTDAPRLAARDLVAGWTPGRVDLGPIDLTIDPGEHVAVTGPNGSGKSTLLAVLARHLDPARGHYTVDGVDVTHLRTDAVRELIAIVDDEPHVLAASLRANLVPAAPTADDAALVTALRSAGLGTWFDGLPESLDTRLGAGGRGVSGGERARLSIARAIASGRPVILLDEPVAHLDHPTADAVLADLLTHAVDRSVIMVTHHGIGLQRMDRIVEISGKEH